MRVAGARARKKDDDRSPLDMCGWCFRWIRHNARREVVALRIDPPLRAGQHFHELSVAGRKVLSVASVVLDMKEDDAPPERESDTILVMLCSAECATGLTQGISDDEARERGETPPSRVNLRERRQAERLLRDVCAWCREDLRDASVRVYAALEGTAERPSRGRMLTLDIGGRLVAGSVPRRGSQAARDGWDLVFECCGQACADRLSEAVDRDSRVH